MRRKRRSISYGVSQPKYIILSSAGSGSLTIPADWNSNQNTIECIAGGKSGQSNSPSGGGGLADAGSGGSGGGYAKVSNVSLTPGSTVSYRVGSTNQSSFVGSLCVATPGSDAGAVGDTITRGGTGGGGGRGDPGGGGGGAGGPHGNGLNGSSSGTGGTGDNGFGGASAQPGTNLADGSVGSGGGNGGLYGGGGKGATGNTTSPQTLSGQPGKQGVIVITYYP